MMDFFTNTSTIELLWRIHDKEFYPYSEEEFLRNVSLYSSQRVYASQLEPFFWTETLLYVKNLIWNDAIPLCGYLRNVKTLTIPMVSAMRTLHKYPYPFRNLEQLNGFFRNIYSGTFTSFYHPIPNLTFPNLHLTISEWKLLQSIPWFSEVKRITLQDCSPDIKDSRIHFV